MKLLAAALCLAFAATPLAHAQKKAPVSKNCEMQAGDPSNPTYEANLKACQGTKAAPRRPVAKAATPAAKPATPAAKVAAHRRTCEIQAGEPSNPTYEANLKACLGRNAAAGGTKKR